MARPPAISTTITRIVKSLQSIQQQTREKMTASHRLCDRATKAIEESRRLIEYTKALRRTSPAPRH